MKEEAGEAVIFEPPTSNTPARVRRTEWLEIASIWDGDAIVSGPVGSERWRRVVARASVLRYPAGALLLIVLPAVALRRFGDVWCGVWLILASTVAATVVHRSTPAGFLRGEKPIEYLSFVLEKDFPYQVGVDEIDSVLDLAGDKRLLLLDARDPAAHEYRRLPGALNMPPTLSAEERLEMLSHVPRDMRIVCYCNLGGCPVASRLAHFLTRKGFLNVQVLKGNWYGASTRPPR